MDLYDHTFELVSEDQKTICITMPAHILQQEVFIYLISWGLSSFERVL